MKQKKIQVIKDFKLSHDGETYRAGSEYKLSDTVAESLRTMGYVKIINKEIKTKYDDYNIEEKIE